MDENLKEDYETKNNNKYEEFNIAKKKDKGTYKNKVYKILCLTFLEILLFTFIIILFVIFNKNKYNYNSLENNSKNTNNKLSDENINYSFK